jgi:membrane protein YdbS with pleckstrin-like domain
MSAADAEWLSLDDGEEVAWTGEPELASRAGQFATGAIMLPLLGLGLLILVPTYLQVKNTDYVVTNQSLYRKDGVLSTNITSVELDRIQNTEYSQSFTEKLLGYGTVGISTAGSSGTEMQFEGIGDAEEVRDAIRKLSKRYRESGGDAGGDAEGRASDHMAELADELARTREALEAVDAAVSQALGSGGAGGRSGGTREGDRPRSGGQQGDRQDRSRGQGRQGQGSRQQRERSSREKRDGENRRDDVR